MRPTSEDAAIWCLFKHYGNEFVDDGKINPAWFSNEAAVRLFDAVLEWRRAGKVPDTIAFASVHGNILERVAAVCKNSDVCPEGFDYYVRDMEDGFYTAEMMGLIESARVLPPRTAYRNIIEYVKKNARLLGDSINFYAPKDYAPQYMEELEKARTGPQTPELLTGFPSLDRQIWGLKRGGVFTVGARTGRGKSIFLLNVAVGLLRSGKKVLYFSTEMTVREKWDRLMTIVSGIPAENFKTGKFTEAEWKSIIEHSGWMFEKNNMIICDLASPTIEHTRNLVRRIKPDVVMIDYLGLFSMPAENRKDLQVAELMKQFKILAREENCALMVASQLNRQTDMRTDKRPQISDLKESGSIEQDSDVVALIYDPQPMIVADRKNIHLLVEKNRHGRVGEIELEFNFPTLTLTETMLADPSVRV